MEAIEEDVASPGSILVGRYCDLEDQRDEFLDACVEQDDVELEGVADVETTLQGEFPEVDTSIKLTLERQPTLLFENKPPVVLISDPTKLPALKAKDLVEQCRARKVGLGGSKSVLINRLEKAIAKDLRVGSTTVNRSKPPRPAKGSSAPVVGPSQTPTTKTQDSDAPWIELTQEQAASARWSRPEYTGPAKGGPSAVADKDLDPLRSTPLDYFSEFIPMSAREKWKTHSNQYAIKCGAGTDKYPNFKPFSTAEIDSLLGLHVRNGLAPVPDMRMHFTNPSSNFVFGDERVQSALPGGFQRLKELKAFFHIQDPTLAEPVNKPFFKVEPLLVAVRDNSERLWYLGPDVSLDEQDCGFQGRSHLKDKIKYKKEGDGFLADCICDSGYTWTFHFRHDPTPMPLTQKHASDLHNRCLYLIKRLKFQWTRIYMDNLFTSRRFLQWGYEEKVLMAGVARATARGVPDCVVQVEAKSKADLEKAVGVAAVNSYLLYKRQCELRKVPKSRILSHMEFNVQLAAALCGSAKRAPQAALAGGSVAGQKRDANGFVLHTTCAPRLTPNLLKRWVGRTLGHHPMKEIPGRPGDASPCQWCKFRSTHAYNGKPAIPIDRAPKSRFGCQECAVWLCGPACWNEFHHLV
ncbi:hypothetical protein CYMTET_10395 [Cymbomonas tetramitiformis]|uniref:SAP domain-containing protein n=1 Tax=Cymbomonas tetramitiformis TaxID=36881 RepID=A0AAE0GPA4_9CHLO|nr:hypothetical protein CYMTET_10395 [Cymbomonas tetramitiformis]